MCARPTVLECGNAILLRGPRANDAVALAKHANDRAVWINLRDAMPHPYSLDDAQQWIERIEHEAPRTSFVIDRCGETIGGIGLVMGNDIERCTAEVGYWLGAAHWGRGIATAALRRISAYGFQELQLHRIFATPIMWNPASFRVLEKAGFAREGVMRNACIKDGRLTDMALYALCSP